MSRIKQSDIFSNEFIERQMILPNPFDHALRQLIAAIIIVMRAVLERFAEIVPRDL